MTVGTGRAAGFVSISIAVLVVVNVLVAVIVRRGSTVELPVSEGAGDLSSDVKFLPDSQLALEDNPVNTEMEFQAVLANHSDEQVSITNVSTTCGCTDVSFSSRELPPHGEVQVTGKVRGRARPGAFNVRLTASVLSLSSSRRGLAELLVTANVVANIQVSPMRIELRPSPDSPDGSSVNVSLRNVSDQKISVLISEMSLPGVSVDNTELLIEPDAEAIVSVSASLEAKQGRGLVKVALRESGEEHFIPIEVRPATSVSVSPEVLVLGVITADSHGLRSSRPAQISFLGKLEKEWVQVTSLPDLLTSSSISETSGGVVLDFLLADEWDGSRPSPIKIRVCCNGKETPMDFSIPVIGIRKSISEK